MTQIKTKTKPYGIFEILDNNITPSSLRDSLDALLTRIEDGREGNRDGMWTWDEVVLSISNYIIIMKQELQVLEEEDDSG